VSLTVEMSRGIVIDFMSMTVPVDSHVIGWHGFYTGQVVVVKVTTSILVVVGGRVSLVEVGGVVSEVVFEPVGVTLVKELCGVVVKLTRGLSCFLLNFV